MPTEERFQETETATSKVRVAVFGFSWGYPQITPITLIRKNEDGEIAI